ncbi:MAG: PAS domain S-box protein [bacterium]|nr:PAS domain S-box protein [bacterium]
MLESEIIYKNLIQTLPDIVYILDKDGNFTYVNESIQKLGYDAEDLIGKHFSVIIHPDEVKDVHSSSVLPIYKDKKTAPAKTPKLFDERRTGDRITRNLRVRFLLKDEVISGDDQLILIEGDVISVGLYEHDKRGERKGYCGTIGIIKEIGEALRTEKALIHAEKHYRLLIENSSDVITILANDGTILYKSESLTNILGWQPVDLIGMNELDYIHPDDVGIIKNVLEEKEDFKSDGFTLYRCRNNEDQWRYMEAWVKMILDDSNKVMCYIINSHDITRRKKAEEELMLSRESIQNIVDKSIDGVLVVDKKGVVRFFNPVVLKMFGIKWRDIMDKPFTYSTLENKLTEINIFDHSGNIGTGEMRVIETEWERHDAWLITIRDITQRKTIENDIKKKHQELLELNEEVNIAHKDLQQKARELEKTGKYKSEFLANMSHELRSPLNSLLILAQNLAENRDGNLIENQVKSAKIIHKSGTDLLMLINDILDLSKIEAGKIKVYVEPVSMADIEESINQSFKHVAVDKGIGLNIKTQKGFPDSIETDMQKLDQILKNLISNSIKFTHEGSVTVDFHLPFPGERFSRKGLNRKDAIAISVIDTGIGIPEDKQQDVFEAFQQADGSTSRNYGGSGLGLSISRVLSRLLGGEIHLKSFEGKGSTFTLYLPKKLEVPEDAQKDKRPARTPITDHKNHTEIDPVFADKKVLLIDDDMRNLFALTKILEDKKINVLKASNGKDGIKILESDDEIDLLLLDLMMPEVDGYEVMKKLRSDDRFANLSILIVTAKAMKEEREKCIESGANGYLTKPLDVDRLFSLMRSHFLKPGNNENEQ